jgi:hypothetical protein
LQGFYEFLAILHGVILAEHAVFIGFYTFSRTTSYLLRFRKVGLQIELVGIEKLFHRRGAKSAEEAQRSSA